MQAIIEKEELKELMREVIREEFLNLAINLMPYVSDKEMGEIESIFTDKDFEDGEFVDGIEWLGR